ncbi:hypothetical protein FVE85_0687 [Porphyridium purpureum]|uniref:DUF1279 domain-containing protein n=1 Tax=Porphyridium purpureum TaxID=35688 RepID=A0A5J4Z0V4_PORPP|nr:hypothetical protein FVE85_0687 [Porphyridium purpureum]|eukprot:POR0921..scf208_2
MVAAAAATAMGRAKSGVRKALGLATAGLATHAAVSAACTAAFYGMLKQHVDVVSLLSRHGINVCTENNMYSSSAGSGTQEWELSEDTYRSALESITMTTSDSAWAEKAEDDEPPLPDGLVRPSMGVYGNGSMVAIAYMCSRAVFAFRVPVTLALTPVVHRLWRIGISRARA